MQPILFLNLFLTQSISQLLNKGGDTGKEMNAEAALLIVSFLMVFSISLPVVPISHPQQEHLLLIIYKFLLSNSVIHVSTINHRPLFTFEDHTTFPQTGASGAPFSPNYFMLQTTAVFFDFVFCTIHQFFLLPLTPTFAQLLPLSGHNI